MNSEPKGTLFEGGAVVTVDDEFTVHDPGWVHAVADRIAALGPGRAPDSIRESVGRRIDASQAVVMPGMVNAHTHLFQTFFRPHRSGPWRNLALEHQEPRKVPGKQV